MSENPRPIRVLQLEDSPLDAEFLRERLQSGGLSCDIVVAATEEQFAAALNGDGFDLILCDYSLPGYDGAAALQLARMKHPLTPVIVVSGALGEEEAVRCLQLGATDYLIKDRLERLVPAVQRALQEAAELKRRNQADEKVRESQQFLRSVSEASPHWIYVFDLDEMGVTYANRSILRDLGYPPEIANATTRLDSFREFMSAGELPHLARVLEEWRTLADGQLHEDEYHLRHADGSTHSFTGREVVFARRPDGTVRQVLGTLADITAHKRTEEALRASEERFRELFEHSPDAIFVESEEGVVLDVNSAGCHLQGLTHGQLLGRHVLDLVPAAERDSVARGFARLASGELTKVEGFSWTADGRAVPVEITSKKVVFSGQPAVLLHVRDITERQQTEAALARESQLLRAVVNHLPDYLYVKDLDSRYLMVNEANVQLMKVARPEETHGKTVFHFFPPEQARAFIADDRSVFESGQPILNREEPITGPDGQTRHLLTTKVPLRDASGQVMGLLGMSRDITEWKQAEEQLRQSEARLANAQRMAKLGNWELDLGNLADVNCNPLRWSDEVFRIFGYEPGEIEVSNENFFRGVHPEDRPRIQTAISQALRDRQPYNLVHRIILPDGSQRIVQEQSEIHFDEHSGQPLKLVGTVQDITELKMVQQALEDSEALYHSLVEHLPMSVFRKDLQGRFTFANARFCEAMGKPLAEVLGKTDFDIAPADLAQRYRDDDLQVIVTGEVLETMEENRSFTGKTRFVQTLKAPLLKADGEIVGIQGIFTDVTERKELEEQLRQSQKFEAIGQLAGGVAHDFNNILTVIQGYSSLLVVGGQSPSKAAYAAQQIVQAAERAANLTRQLLAFSRRQVMQPRLLDLNEIVTSLTRMLQRIMGEDVRLQLSLHPLPLITRADAGMLDQVLLNLVVNARDAMPGGGELVIETGERIFTEADAASIPDASAGRQVCLRVIDTGCGIEPELRARIFEPFFTTKGQGKGTGLGLATVFGIVKQHGGSITVESEVGKGTTFQIFLPAEGVAGEARSEKATSAEPCRGTECILLVEDEPTVRMLTCAVLEQAGYQVLEAADGPAALRIWEQHQDSIDLLLTDIVMPEGISGFELAARLRERNPRLRIIFTSGYSADIAGKELTLQEGQNFLPKPAVPQKLLKIVRQCLDG